MSLLNNAKTLLTQPLIAKEYFDYKMSCFSNSGQAIRVLDSDLKISGLSGFSEFHSCKNFVNEHEKTFLSNYDFGEGDIIDVGANLGVVSLLLAKRPSKPIVHAFEANPYTFEALQENVTLNRCPNIRAHNLAIAGYDGEITFNANPVYRGTTSITASIDSHTVHVPCITLDSYVQQQSIKQVSLLKVDVEGYEELVFQGCKNLLAQQKIKVIYYEICPTLVKKAGLSPYTPTQALLDYGYKIYRLSQDDDLTSVTIAEIESFTCENLIALPS